MSNIKKQKGVTIIELLIYIALLSIFLVVLLDVFVTTLNFKLESESTSNLNQDGRYIMAKIAYDVYNSDSFSVPNSSELDVVNGGITTKYTLSGGNLVLGSMALNSLGTTVSSLSFVKVGTTVQLAFTLKSQVVIKNSQETESFQEALAPR